MNYSRWAAVIIALMVLAALFRLPLVLLIAIFLALVTGASRLWQHNSLVGVEYHRQLGQHHLDYGEETELTVEIINRKPLPLAWLKIEDDFPDGVELVTGKLQPHNLPHRWLLVNLLTMRWYERVRRRYRLRGSQRGLFEFGPAQVTSGDIFGFSRQQQDFPSQNELIVYPKVVPITRLGLPAQQPFGDFKAPRRLLEDPLRFMSIREYAPGDPFRHIHWKATARTHQLQTRVYEPTTTWQLLIFLDVQTLARAYQGVIPEYLELAISAAASIAQHALETGYQVGLYANASAMHADARVRIPPSRDPAQLPNLLSALAQITYITLAPLETILAAEAGKLPYGVTMVVISALQTSELLAALLDLKTAGHAVALLTIGDDRPRPELPGVRVYPLGGQKEWYELAHLEIA